MISTIIPSQNSWDNVSASVRLAMQNSCVEEIIVLDDGSIDEMNDLEDSAPVKRIRSILPGKGASMEEGLKAAQNDIVLFLDGSLDGLASDVIHRLTEPIVEQWAAFAKPACTADAAPAVTLTTQLALHSFFPELDSYSQPFSGIAAGRRGLFETLLFESDYGVHIGLLIDAVMSGEALAEVDIGQVSYDVEPLDVVGDMASQVLRTVIERASKYGRLTPRQIEELRQIHRQIETEIAIALARPQRPMGLALFAMDGVLLQEPFIPKLAKRTDRSERLTGTLNDSEMEMKGRITEVAAVFAQVPKAIFEDVAHDIPLTAGAREAVLGLRKAGFRVAVVTDGFQVAADVVRRRVGADFAVGHLMQFRHGVATGEVTMSPAMAHPAGCASHPYCKMNALLRLLDRTEVDRNRILTVGHAPADICMLRAATLPVAFRPQTDEVSEAAAFLARQSLSEVLQAT
jgi:glucosyl-3-phosphoglycerate synthase